MVVKKKGLGRGLDALLGANTTQSSANPLDGESALEPTVEPKSELRELPVDLLRPGQYQPRRDMHPEALEELAASIKAQGVMQPIVVRSVGMQQYEIIAGERRWRASQLAGLDSIPVVIKDVPDEAAIAMALIENIQREDLNPMEEANALQRLQAEFELTHQEIADAVGKSRTTVTNLLRLTQLQPDVRTMLEHGDLEMGHARALLALEPRQQGEVARKVASQGLTVRQAEELVRKTQQPSAKTGKSQQKDGNTLRLEEDLSEKVGAPVSIKYNHKGKGTITFNYASLDELQGILEHIS